jgi:CheY-like chemotaxis protein/nitrogen-specific signal transduction histidine kinase
VNGVGRIFRNGEDRPARMVGVCSDITERKHAEEALKEADRRKDAFLATLSHELRNPINAVIGWAQMLRAKGFTSEWATHGLEVIERNARAEAQMVESLLDLSRISAGKLELDSAHVDLGLVIQRAVDAAQPAAEATGITLEVICSAREAFTVGDPARLQQVISNLLTNALKFTPPAGHIRICLERVDSWIQVQVIDDGEGIAPELLPFVFDRFRQADTTRERRHAGLGLGLTIVRELIHAHGGTVSADSPGLGKGSIFTVRLPAAAASDAPDALVMDTNAVSPRPSIAAISILVVDDDRDARQLAGMTLEAQGATVRLASSAAEALALIARHDFHVLVADIGMPGEDGCTLVRNLRHLEQAEQRKRLPAIAVTAYAAVTDREEVLAAGYDLHLPKPVDPNALIRAVAQVSGAAEV